MCPERKFHKSVEISGLNILTLSSLQKLMNAGQSTLPDWTLQQPQLLGRCEGDGSIFSVWGVGKDLNKKDNVISCFYFI